MKQLMIVLEWVGRERPAFRLLISKSQGWWRRT